MLFCDSICPGGRICIVEALRSHRSIRESDLLAAAHVPLPSQAWAMDEPLGVFVARYGVRPSRSPRSSSAYCRRFVVGSRSPSDAEDVEDMEEVEEDEFVRWRGRRGMNMLTPRTSSGFIEDCPLLIHPVRLNFENSEGSRRQSWRQWLAEGGRARIYGGDDGVEW